MTARRWAAVYGEGQGTFLEPPDPFDDEIRTHKNAVTGDCNECGVEHHELDLFTCPRCQRAYCERHIDEDEHDCTPDAPDAPDDEEE